MDMRVVPKGINSHQVKQQLLLMAHDGLATGCRSLRSSRGRKPTKVAGEVAIRALEDI